MAIDIKETPNSIPWPPLIYAAAILMGAFSGFVLPKPWLSSPTSDFLAAIGGLLIAAGLFVDFSAMRTLARAKTTIAPNKSAQHLVTNGPFSFSRNPIYLANTFITAGIGFMSGIIWFLPLALVAAMLTERLAIKREEAHLEARFGKAFRDYSKKVRRWI